MRGFERVVALPDPKKCVLPSRINSLEVQTNLFHDPERIKLHDPERIKRN
jgi:hypothetical protein